MTTHPLPGWALERLRRPWLPIAVSLVLLWLAVVALHGVWPGQLHNLSISYFDQAAAECLHDLGSHALTQYCHQYGQPGGAPLLSNGPMTVAAALLLRLPGIAPDVAYGLALAIAIAIALGAGALLARRIGMSWAIAAPVSAAYLLSLSVLGMQGFLGTYEGFILLPAYLLADVLLVRGAMRGSMRRASLVLIAYAILRCVALFQDGYSFVASVVAGAVIVAFGLAQADRTARERLLVIGCFVVANIAAVGLYKAYVPGIPFDGPIGVFRAQGLDLVTLVAPSNQVGVFSATGGGQDFARLWGDGTNSSFNYVGLLCLALAAVGLVARRGHWLVRALAVTALLCLLLSLGPSIKLGVQRTVTPGLPTAQSYLMPADLAPTSPWKSVYGLPGIDAMRATYRWFAVTRLVLLLLAGLGVAALLSRGRWWRVAGVALAIAGVVEVLPGIAAQRDHHDAAHTALRAVQEQVVDPLREDVRQGEQAIFLSPDAQLNDYMAGLLAVRSGLRVYNAAGDKNTVFSMASWPPEIRAVALDPSADNALAALHAGRVSVLIAPRFDLRTSAYRWPPDDAEIESADARFAPLLADKRLRVVRQRWVTVIRERRVGRPSRRG